MTTTSNMIIFHEPDILEFAANGKTLGQVQLSGAEALFCSIKQAPADQRPQLIQNTFYQFLGDRNV